MRDSGGQSDDPDSESCFIPMGFNGDILFPVMRFMEIESRTPQPLWHQAVKV